MAKKRTTKKKTSSAKKSTKKAVKKTVKKATKKAVSKKSATKKKVASKGSGKLIMVVDDEADNRTTVKTVLEKNGYSVVTARSADDCYSKFKKQKPALILMDIMMPGTPVREIIPKLKGTKIAYLSVVRTSEAEREDLMSSKNVVDFIQKPFSIDELLSKVKKLAK